MIRAFYRRLLALGKPKKVALVAGTDDHHARDDAGRDDPRHGGDLLKIREGDGAHGLPITPKIGRLRFEEAAADLLNVDFLFF